MSTQTTTKLSLLKMKMIEQIVSEQSLDTLQAWYDMYEEARYVASLDSDEEELIKYRAECEELLKKGFDVNRNV